MELNRGCVCWVLRLQGGCVTVFCVADMHMMVSRPEQWVKPMAAAGASQYTFHIEATTNPGNLIKEIRESGMKVRRWCCEARGGGALELLVRVQSRLRKLIE